MYTTAGQTPQPYLFSQVHQQLRVDLWMLRRLRGAVDAAEEEARVHRAARALQRPCCRCRRRAAAAGRPRKRRCRRHGLGAERGCVPRLGHRRAPPHPPCKLAHRRAVIMLGVKQRHRGRHCERTACTPGRPSASMHAEPGCACVWGLRQPTSAQATPSGASQPRH